MLNCKNLLLEVVAQNNKSLHKVMHQCEEKYTCVVVEQSVSGFVAQSATAKWCLLEKWPAAIVIDDEGACNAVQSLFNLVTF